MDDASEFDRVRLLIVEDDEDTADLLAQQLEREGWSIDVARNGQEAILFTGEQPPDLVIMDVMMPKLNGFETTRFFKAKFQGAYVPVMVLSAKHSPADIKRGARFGCDEYMGKPYSRKDLLAAVESLVRLSKVETRFRELSDELEKQMDTEEGAGNLGLEVTRTQEKVVNARYEWAKHLLADGRGEVARVHVKRVLELNSDHAGAQELLSKIGE